MIREALDDLVRTWRHRADTNSNGAFQSATLMCMTDLVGVLIKHDLNVARHATTEPGELPPESDPYAEPLRLPPQRPLPTIEEP